MVFLWFSWEDREHWEDCEADSSCLREDCDRYFLCLFQVFQISCILAPGLTGTRAIEL